MMSGKDSISLSKRGMEPFSSASNNMISGKDSIILSKRGLDPLNSVSCHSLMTVDDIQKHRKRLRRKKKLQRFLRKYIPKSIRKFVKKKARKVGDLVADSFHKGRTFKSTATQETYAMSFRASTDSLLEDEDLQILSEFDTTTTEEETVVIEKFEKVEKLIQKGHELIKDKIIRTSNELHYFWGSTMMLQLYTIVLIAILSNQLWILYGIKFIFIYRIVERIHRFTSHFLQTEGCNEFMSSSKFCMNCLYEKFFKLTTGNFVKMLLAKRVLQQYDVKSFVTSSMRSQMGRINNEVVRATQEVIVHDKNRVGRRSILGRRSVVASYKVELDLSGEISSQLGLS